MYSTARPHRRCPRHTQLACCLAAGAAMLCLILPVGCRSQDPPKPASKYTMLGLREVPAFMKGTIYEVADLQATQAFPTSGWGLVVGLRNTGDTRAPSYVREYILRQLVVHGFGGLNEGLQNVSPQRVLSDPQVAIVRVDGLIPPGARKGQRFDVYLSLPRGNRTTSLAHGNLYQANLYIAGADTTYPEGSVNAMATCRGDIFVNPTYALATAADAAQMSTAAKASARTGVILGGGMVDADWPLLLRLRLPSFQTAKNIESRIEDRYQGIGDKTKIVGSSPNSTAQGIAEAMDDGLIRLYVPRSYSGDWQRLTGVVTHLYLDSSPANLAAKARMLADEAVKPDAPLQDISYCWEGIGNLALPVVQELMNHPSPAVAFAATRAAAFLGDPGALVALGHIAASPGHPFRLTAVQVLGALPPSQSVREVLRRLLDAPEALVRIAAYEALARHQDPSVYSQIVQQKFVLDLVPSKAPPIVYATRLQVPRIAIIGDRVGINLPITFSALDGRFTIASTTDDKYLSLFYRSGFEPPVHVLSHPNLAEVVARLGGEGAQDDPQSLDFSYGDIVAILQALSTEGKLSTALHGQDQSVAFMLQQAPALQGAIYAAPDASAGTPAVAQAPSPGATDATGGLSSPEALPDFNPNATVAPPAGGAADGGAARPQ